MWAQTIEQAEAAKAKPVLAIKVNRRGWTCYVDMADLNDSWQPRKSWAAIEPEDFFQLVRDGMPCAPTSI
jgi:Holliday junction resolvase